ncbi:MAG: DegT/DnrJ/EryC1/StrS aminotransferase family protein [Myxococcota bacterium]
MDSPREARLAVDGGAPVRSAPWPRWPAYDEEQIEAASAVLRSGRVNYWTGDNGRSFEREYAESLNVGHGIALANGTVALELCLWALGIGPGDDVVVTSRSFVASASCVAARGARPVFADVDLDSQNVTAATIEQALTPQTRAIIVVHLYGWPADLDSIMELAARHDIKVIEDCAQAHGATYKGRLVGSIGHVNAFSFCQDKIITTGGEGGLLTTDDESIWNTAWSLKDHGKSYDTVYRKKHPPGYRLLHEAFGTNFRMTEMQAAMGRIQLRELPKQVALRRRNAAILTESFQQLPALRVVHPPADVEHSYYKYSVCVRPERLKPGWDRHKVQDAIGAEGVPCSSGYLPMYREKVFPADWTPKEELPNSSELGDTSLLFPVHPTLEEADMRSLCDAVEKVLSAATA